MSILLFNFSSNRIVRKIIKFEINLSTTVKRKLISKRHFFYLNNKMRSLKTNQQVLTWLCVFPPEKCVSTWKRIADIAFTLIIVVGQLLCVISSASFIWKYVSTNLEESLFSLVHSIPGSGTLYQGVVILILRRSLIAIFDQLSKIYDKSEIYIWLNPNSVNK